MTEEEIQALQEAKEAAEKKAEEAEAAALKAQGDLTGVVDELKEERTKKNEALEKLEKFNNPNPGQEPSVAEQVEQALAKKEEERVKSEVEEAIESFKASKTEFQTDTSGIVFEKFKKDLSKFSFADVKSQAEAKQRLEEAYEFIRGKQSPEEGGPDYEGTNPAPNTPSAEDKTITQDTKRTLETNNIEPERFNKLNSKYGDALAGLGFGR